MIIRLVTFYCWSFVQRAYRFASAQILTIVFAAQILTAETKRAAFHIARELRSNRKFALPIANQYALIHKTHAISCNQADELIIHYQSTTNDLISAKYSLKYEGMTICTVLPEMA